MIQGSLTLIFLTVLSLFCKLILHDIAKNFYLDYNYKRNKINLNKKENILFKKS